MQIKIKLTFISAISLLSLGLVTCKKDKDKAFAVATLNVTNVSTGISNAQVITPNVTGYHSLIAGVYSGSNYVFTVPAGNGLVSFYNQADTTKPFYTNTFLTNSGDIYSVFIGGDAGQDVVVNKDNLAYYADSSFGVRFVNMSPDSPPVNVDLAASTTVNEFSNVAYKSITDFKKYDGHIDDYTFEVRDGSGTLLATTDVAIAGADPRMHHNVTLVFYGLIGSSPSLLVENNY